jgi:hypothetical protein
MTLDELIKELLDKAYYKDDSVKVVDIQGVSYDIEDIKVGDFNTIELIINKEDVSEELF